jgi:hypothetical protein
VGSVALCVKAPCVPLLPATRPPAPPYRGRPLSQAPAGSPCRNPASSTAQTECALTVIGPLDPDDDLVAHVRPVAGDDIGEPRTGTRSIKPIRPRCFTTHGWPWYTGGSTLPQTRVGELGPTVNAPSRQCPRPNGRERQMLTPGTHPALAEVGGPLCGTTPRRSLPRADSSPPSQIPRLRQSIGVSA